jgi:hypothetical protein
VSGFLLSAKAPRNLPLHLTGAALLVVALQHLASGPGSSADQWLARSRDAS